MSTFERMQQKIYITHARGVLIFSKNSGCGCINKEATAQLRRNIPSVTIPKIKTINSHETEILWDRVATSLYTSRKNKELNIIIFDKKK